MNDIRTVLTNGKGDLLPLGETRNVEAKLEIATADLYTRICRFHNDTPDAETRREMKFDFALVLKNYLNEVEKK